MRFLLTPKRSDTYGQDFLAGPMREQCGLSAIDPEDEPAWPSTPSLLISQNPDSKRETDIILALPPQIAAVVHVHCQYDYYNKAQQFNIERSLSRSVFGITPAAFSTSQLARRFPKIAWHTVNNGIDPIRFQPSTLEDRNAWRLERGIVNSRLLVGFVGRLETAKGVQLLEDFVRLSEDTRVHLLLQFFACDEKSSKAAQLIRKLAPDRVSLYPDSDVSTLRPVRHLDLLLHPSLSEVCPLVVLEALHSGVPVLATRSTPFYSELEQLSFPNDFIHLIDLPILSEHTRSKLSVSAEDAKRSARHLVEIANNFYPPTDGFRARLARNVLGCRFSQNKMAASFNQIYSEALELHRDRRRTARVDMLPD